jgi:cytochrome c551/c552
MRKIIIGAALALGLVAFACGGKQGPSAEAGKKLFAQNGCALCHGEDASGKGSMAPGLKDMAAWYTKDKMISYLENPLEYSKTDQRLSEQARKYSSGMPNYSQMGKQKLEELAEYLLSL